ncbi:MAG: hypothetical protein LBE62_01285 [Azonexus sp.]|jgi:hypothetical protein|nr:hypothetical protein [Azonexus sp.]
MAASVHFWLPIMDPRSPFSRGAFIQGPQSALGKVLASLAGFALLVLGLMFSLVLLAVAVVGGALLAGWWWWRTRALRQAMGSAASAAESVPQGVIIEGEIISKTTDSEHLPE